MAYSVTPETGSAEAELVTAMANKIIMEDTEGSIPRMVKAFEQINLDL